MFDVLGRRLESPMPFFQRLRVVQPQVLDIQHAESPRFKDLRHLRQAGRFSSGEDVLVVPRIERRRHVPPDGVNQPAPVRLERTVDQTTQLGKVADADMLQHADRNEGVKPATNLAIVVFEELHPIAQPLGLRAFASVGQLLAGDVERPHAHAVLPSHVQRERSPTTTGLDHRFSRLQPQLAADVIQLRHLSFFQRQVRPRVIRAGVNELLVEPLLIEFIADVVVVEDTRLRFGERVPMSSPLPTLAQPTEPTRRTPREGSIEFH